MTSQDGGGAEGLSAPVGNLHRAGTARAGTGRLRWSSGRACAGRRTASAIRCMTRSGRRFTICRNISMMSRAGAPRPARKALAHPGFCRGACGCFLADLCARPDTQPRAALRPGDGAGGRMAGRRDLAARAFHPHAGLGHALCQPDHRIALDLLGACQGYLDVARLGACGQACASARWTVTCTKAGYEHLQPLADGKAACI